jgi:integrase
MISREQEIEVQPIRRAGRKQWQFRWHDPQTGKGGECNSGVPRSASRTAAALAIPAFVEKKKADRPAPSGTWEEFCRRVVDELFPDWRPSTRQAWETARRQVEAIICPVALADVSREAILRFRAVLADKQTKPDTYLRTLRSVLKSAEAMYPGYKAPEIRTGKAEPGGRPLSRKEFKVLLAATEGVVGADRAIEWRRLLRVVAWTGLRKRQAVQLSWDADAPIRVERIGKRTAELVIEASDHKGKRSERFPLLPPARSALREVPRERRVGPVFCLGTDAHGYVGEVVAAIGKASGIVTGRRLSHRAEEVVEVDATPTMHDLKRTFCRRLAELGFAPTEIARLAQHRSFSTTWEFYVPRASELGDRVRSLFARAGKRKVLKIRRA